jgi:protein TonB
VALPKPQPEEKEKPREKEEPKEAALQEPTPQQDADIPITSAPPRVEAQPSPGATRSPDQSARLGREHERWAIKMSQRLQRFKRYPEAAERRNIEGVTIVRFTVDRSGQLVASEVLQSSGSPILDEEALALLKRASPFPAPPDGIPDTLLENSLPVGFVMKPRP